jgi:hypothetical protein
MGSCCPHECACGRIDHKTTRNLLLAVLAYARVDFGAGRPESYCTSEDIAV